MKLSPEAREAVNALIAGAHEDGKPTRAIAAKVVAGLHGMRPTGLPWVSTYLYELAIGGAMVQCRDWRRNHQVAARTKTGLPVSLPAYVGRTTPDGEAVQLSLVGLGLEELRSHKERLSKQRNTLSIEVKAIDALIAVMEADEDLATVGDALVVLMGEAA